MADTQIILDAIQAVREDVSALDARVAKVTDDHEERIRAVEKTDTRLKAVATAFVALAGFFGWDVLKHHVP